MGLDNKIINFINAECINNSGKGFEFKEKTCFYIKYHEEGFIKKKWKRSRSDEDEFMKAFPKGIDCSVSNRKLYMIIEMKVK